MFVVSIGFYMFFADSSIPTVVFGPTSTIFNNYQNINAKKHANTTTHNFARWPHLQVPDPEAESLQLWEASTVGPCNLHRGFEQGVCLILFVFPSDKPSLRDDVLMIFRRLRQI